MDDFIRGLEQEMTENGELPLILPRRYGGDPSIWPQVDIYGFSEPGHLQWEDQQGNPLAINFGQSASDVVRGQVIYDASARVGREAVRKMYLNKAKAMNIGHIINPLLDQIGKEQEKQDIGEGGLDWEGPEEAELPRVFCLFNKD